ncbi:MAG: quinoprotein dehydrogenase-associated SoxYZ-like carrier [Hyphomicrobium sp.]|uniref:quinoprotein dehydrogenase-associated SoxYZ-like carrier n=1 Tax=Hyphomicrobium sp. TaxID=82 RepID=UPI0039E441FF
MRKALGGIFGTAVLVAAMSFGALAEDGSPTVANPSAWDGIRKDAFGQREILDGAGKIVLEAPVRAEDAATVPITVRMPAAFAAGVKSLTLIIDQNPSPVVATFNYGDAAGNGERMLATRVRVDQYSDVRAIAETNDNKLYMTTAFVKASGGCSAPASKDAEEAAKTMGKMHIKTAVAKEDGSEVAQVMLKHPNTSGMAMDQITHAYPPARFIDKLSVTTGGKLIFSMEGGISISEDPNFRFTYQGNPSDEMAVKAEDSAGTQFSGHSTPSQS